MGNQQANSVYSVYIAHSVDGRHYIGYCRKREDYKTSCRDKTFIVESLDYLADFETAQEAAQAERDLQLFLDVVNDPDFANKAIWPVPYTKSDRSKWEASVRSPEARAKANAKIAQGHAEGRYNYRHWDGKEAAKVAWTEGSESREKLMHHRKNVLPALNKARWQDETWREEHLKNYKGGDMATNPDTRRKVSEANKKPEVKIPRRIKCLHKMLDTGLSQKAKKPLTEEQIVNYTEELQRLERELVAIKQKMDGETEGSGRNA